MEAWAKEQKIAVPCRYAGRRDIIVFVDFKIYSLLQILFPGQ